MKPSKTVVITGTHLTPALAVIDQLKKNGWHISYFGRRTSLGQSQRLAIEHQLLPQKKIPVINIIASRWRRSSYLSLLKLSFKLPLGIIQSAIHLIKLKPNLVVSFGGYVSLPVCLASKLLNIPFILHEQTFTRGASHKLLAPLATKIAVSWPSSQKHFPAKKTIVTGNPIRKEFLVALKQPRRSASPPLIYLTAGNQGSRIINQTINPILPSLLSHYQIIHQFGHAQSDSSWQQAQEFKKQLKPRLRSRYRLQRWFSASEQAKFFRQASLVISRAGINTITELAITQSPALLIPLPHTQKNEQEKNARFLQQLDLATILPQIKLTPAKLKQVIVSTTRSTKSKLQSQSTLKPLPAKIFSLITSATNNLSQLIHEVAINKKKDI